MTILTTHVGSLPRNQEVVDFIFAREHGTPYDTPAFDAAMTRAVSETVRKQVEAGVDIVSDGEQSKPSYTNYMKDRLNGFGEGGTDLMMPQDLELNPNFRAMLARNGVANPLKPPACIGPISTKDKAPLLEDLRNFRAAVRTHKASLLEVGALRGHLQRVGLLDYLSDFTPTPAGQHASAWWLVDRFRGDDNRLVGDEIMLTCFQRALDRHNELIGAPAMTIPDTYRIPDSVGRWQTVGYSVEDGS